MTHFAQAARLLLRKKISAGILEQSMGARNRIGNFTRNRVVVPARKATLAESIPGLLFYYILFYYILLYSLRCLTYSNSLSRENWAKSVLWYCNFVSCADCRDYLVYNDVKRKVLLRKNNIFCFLQLNRYTCTSTIYSRYILFNLKINFSWWHSITILVGNTKNQIRTKIKMCLIFNLHTEQSTFLISLPYTVIYSLDSVLECWAVSRVR